MTRFSQLPLQRKLLWIVALAVTMAAAISALVLVIYETTTFRPRVLHALRADAEIMAAMLAPAVDFGDDLTAARQLGTMHGRPDLRAAAIYLPSGASFASHQRLPGEVRMPATRPPDPAGEAESNVVTLMQPMAVGNRTVGHLWLQFDLPPVSQRLYQYGAVAAASAFSLVVLAVMLSLTLQRTVSRPLRGLATVAQAVTDRKDYSLRAPVERDDEVGRLAAAFNNMLATVQQRDIEREQHQERLARQNRGLVEIARTEQQFGEDAVSALGGLNEILVRVLDVDRVGIWLFEGDDLTMLRCADLYSRLTGNHERGSRLAVDASAPYLMSLDGERAVEVTDCRTDPRTAGLRETYTEPLGIGAMLDVPIRWRNRVVGVLCHEHVGGPRAWHRDEVSFAVFATDRVALALEADESARAEASLRESETRYRSLIDEAKDAIFTLSNDGRILELNKAVEVITGWEPTLWIGRNFTDPLLPEDREKARALFAEVVQGGHPPSFELRIRSRSGKMLDLEFAISPRYKNGQVAGLLGIGRDITERKSAAEAQRKLEVQLRQSQKMEAIGTLAGGIAHDFNNMLTGIIGNAQLASMDLAPNSPTQEFLRGVTQAGNRARDLVRQILTFSRRQEHQVVPTRLDTLVREALELLRPSLPSSIAIELRLADSLPRILADPTMVHQILMNLMTNAAHAIGEDPGRIEIGAEAVRVDEAMAEQRPQLRVGEFVRLRVDDNGCGMDAATQQRIFDPFFTTKEAGRGTGLGLAVVHGIMQQHQGAIVVYSTVGRGSSFQLYFPVAGEAAAAPAGPTAGPALVPGNGERILVVDDETIITNVCRRFLERAHYRVETFNDAVKAHAHFLSDPLAYDLVIVDLTMPGMKGTTLASHLQSVRPGLPILLATGYLGDLNLSKLQEMGVFDTIGKPFTGTSLTWAVSRALRGANPG